MQRNPVAVRSLITPGHIGVSQLWRLPITVRLHLAENRFRLAEVLLGTAESGRHEDLFTIDASASLSAREARWFTN